MKSFLKFLAVVLAIVILSSLLAPWLFTFLPFKFERIFHRLIMIFSLIAAVFFVRIKKENLMEFGLAWTAESPRFFSKTFLIGLFTILLFSVLKLLFHDAVLSTQHPGILGWTLFLLKITAASLLIGVIEEFFFRGFLFQTLRKRFSFPLILSVTITSAIYSVVHFLRDYKPLIGPNPTFFDSLKLAGAPVLVFSNWHEIWPEALGLFLFGVILNDLAVRTKSLYPSIGLHAGCVFAVKLDGMLINHWNQHPFYLGTEKVLDGLLGWVLLLLLFVLLRISIKTQTLRPSF
ncbi:MAG: CPBP family intramembrane metalloprotease [Candidatus Omnitrophica bacterium]|nr:CPBP family intramembrane metalloprotease [Candidatus Omnitrophota bacterium]